MTAQKYRRWRIPVIAFALIGLYTGIALTGSRTAMLQVACFFAGLAFLAVQRMTGKRPWKKIALGLLAGAVCAVIVIVSFGWLVEGVLMLRDQLTALAEEAAGADLVKRDWTERLDSFGGRMVHYKGIMNLLQEQPKVLLTGILNSKLVRVLLEYAHGEHAHNSFLQTLVNVGIPGLLMALFFTVRALWVSFRLIFHKKAAFADQILAVILLCFLILTIPESYLFTEYLTAANMPFFLVFGYALEAERGLRESKPSV